MTDFTMLKARAGEEVKLGSRVNAISSLNFLA